MVEDVVRGLGLLCLGTRLKRLAERLQADTDSLLSAADPRLGAALHPYLVSFEQHGPLSVGELADSIGVSQPAATRAVGQLVGLGLVEVLQTDGDQRRRSHRITSEGMSLLDTARERVWPAVTAAVAEIAGGFDGPLLRQLAAIEAQLDTHTLAVRAKRLTQEIPVTHGLDRPVWASLMTRHNWLGQGGAIARRYRPDVSPFAAVLSDDREALAALAALVAPREHVLFLQAGSVPAPPGLQQVSTADALQLVASGGLPTVEDARIERLGPTDAEDMLTLAGLTKPGPFSIRALELGRFWGIRDAGRLVAMCGERLKPPGFTEVSGLAVHPDWQGRGLGRLMLCHVAGVVTASGDRPFLHSYADNRRAISLYESIGFEARSPITAAVFARA